MPILWLFCYRPQFHRATVIEWIVCWASSNSGPMIDTSWYRDFFFHNQILDSPQILGYAVYNTIQSTIYKPPVVGDKNSTTVFPACCRKATKRDGARRMGNLLLCILSPGRDEADQGDGSVVRPRTLDRLILVTLLNRGKQPRYIDTVDRQKHLPLFRRVTQTKQSMVLGGTTLLPCCRPHLLEQQCNGGDSGLLTL